MRTGDSFRQQAVSVGVIQGVNGLEIYWMSHFTDHMYISPIMHCEPTKGDFLTTSGGM